MAQCYLNKHQSSFLLLFHIGESALHFAIINNSLETVKLLVERFNAKVDQRASGKFFRPADLAYSNTDTGTYV